MCGNSSTSRIDGWFVNSMTSAIDADAEPRRRRQAVFERADVVGVVEHRLVVAGRLARSLLAKARGLVVGIVELGEAVGDLAAADEELEAIGDERVRVVASRQRRDLGRIRVDERRLQQPVLGGLLERSRSAACRRRAPA